MKCWLPHIDLHRLCTAAEEDILAASDAEVRQALRASGGSVPRTAAEVRNLIAAVTGDQDEHEAPQPPAGAVGRDEHWVRPH